MTLSKFFSKNRQGFTVVELMVVVSIIGILSTVTYASFSQAQKKARIAKRVSDLKQMQVALEYYYAVNKAYPDSGGVWITECVEFNGNGNNVIPGLVPNYIASIPKDPKSSATSGANRPMWGNCYMYINYNTQGYAFVAHAISEFTAADYLARPELMDAVRDGGSSATVVDGAAPWAWKVWGGQGYQW